jgi:hypothetical protein
MTEVTALVTALVTRYDQVRLGQVSERNHQRNCRGTSLRSLPCHRTQMTASSCYRGRRSEAELRPTFRNHSRESPVCNQTAPLRNHPHKPPHAAAVVARAGYGTKAGAHMSQFEPPCELPGRCELCGHHIRLQGHASHCQRSKCRRCRHFGRMPGSQLCAWCQSRDRTRRRVVQQRIDNLGAESVQPQGRSTK